MTTDANPPDPTELSVGERGPEVVVEDVDRQDFVRYAGASGDFNPVHYDDPYARDAGYPSVFGQGILTAGIATRAATDWFGLANVDRFRVRFREKLWPGDTVCSVCEVTDVGRDGSAYRVDADIICETRDGTALLTGDISVTLPIAGAD